MSDAFRVRTVLTDEDTKTNHVYLTTKDASKYVGPGRAGIVMINEFPFSVSVNDQVGEGQVAMNSIQRRLLKSSSTAGSTIYISLPPKATAPAIVRMTLEVEHIMASKKGGTLDCKEFCDFVAKQFAGQWFRYNQQFAVVYSNMRLIATVLSMIANGKDCELGCLSPTSELAVASSPKSDIQLTNMSDNQMDAQQQALVQNFNLENLGIGGLREEFGQVFRRAFASRMFPASYVKKLGVKHVKGVLLFGPPGTGKTLIARKIGEILNCHPPKIVNGPEVFNKFVGGTEENIRKLFTDAEAEMASKGEQSKLHLIIFDEFDAICKQRGASRDSTGVNDNVVNQLLSKIDGVNSLNNVLLIGMTNRKDLIDEAVLRPGRFEVHVEIGLPDEPGRVEIFRIHTKGMRDNNVMGSDVDLLECARLTKNYSGAEIEGVVRSATSNAFNRHIDLDNPTEVKNANEIKVCWEDFTRAISEVRPAFGQAKEECGNLKRGGIINYGKSWEAVHNRCTRYVEQLTNENKRISSLSVLIDGIPGSGKSAVAAYIAELAAFPFIKVISNDDMVGYGEMQKVNIIRKSFEDAYKSPSSCIILDDLERLIDFSLLGGRYSNALLQALLVLIKRPPPEGKKLLILATTSQYSTMESLELVSCFSVQQKVPLVLPNDVPFVLRELKTSFESPSDETSVVDLLPHSLPIKQLLLILEMATRREGNRATVSFSSISQALDSAGIV